MNLLSMIAKIGVHLSTKHLHSSLLLPSYSSFSVRKFIHGSSFKCARIGGVEIPNNKPLEYSLQYIHGVGPARARQILCSASIFKSRKSCELTPRELNNLCEEVDKYMIGGDLSRLVYQDIERLKVIGCYRGCRHMDMMPVRGQRTRTNSQTWKRKDNRKFSSKKSKREKPYKKKNLAFS